MKPGIINHSLVPLYQLVTEPAKKNWSKRGDGLWGDVFTKTDSFMKVFLGNQTFQTSVISDDDSPQWNEEKFEVWDEDYHFLDRQNDLLGSCATTVQAGSVTSMCEMNHGYFYISYAAECAPGLRGTTCSEYSHL
uniref:C2 domain-containing protein n=1 Tax=Xiphophorus maculatus TaxID=8083 RepID=A0A3B5R4G2_XIPMA